MSKTFYITTPIFYPNAKPHIGHAYTITISDILARYHRLIGDDTYFLSGTDENTEKVAHAARELGEDPQTYLDDIVEQFKALYTNLNISNDQFIRTTDKNIHWPGAQELWRRLAVKGDIAKKSYSGLYCTGHETFLTEKDLVNGKCPDHDEKPELVEEENYFFNLSKYTEQIKQKIESDELHIITKTSKNEILSLLSSGLEDISFSRPRDKMTSGIPVPGDETQKMYVWCDALSNYITALGFGRGEELMHYWPGMHVIGKDILRFHAAIWPGMLLSAGLPLPQAILVHGFITSGGRKMSKTLGNVIDPQELIDEYGADAVRYYLARHVSSFEDGDVTKESFKEAYNANLANGLGNLVARIMKMAESYLDNPVDVSTFRELSGVNNHTENFEFNRAMDNIWFHVKEMDEFIQTDKPFKLIKINKVAAQKRVTYYVQELNRIAVHLKPFMPETSKKIQKAIKENKMPEALFPRKD